MRELRTSVEVAASPEAVFEAITAWTRQGEWMPGTAVHVTKGAGTAVGDEILARTAVARSGPAARLGFDDPMRITVWDAPRRCDVLHLGRVVRGSGSFIVTPSGSGSRFEWYEEVDAPFGKLGDTLLGVGRPVFEAVLTVALKRFGRWLERSTA